MHFCIGRGDALGGTGDIVIKSQALELLKFQYFSPPHINNVKSSRKPSLKIEVFRDFFMHQNASF